MGHDRYNALIVARDIGQQLGDLRSVCGIEAGRRLVGEHHDWLGGWSRPCDSRSRCFSPCDIWSGLRCASRPPTMSSAARRVAALGAISLSRKADISSALRAAGNEAVDQHGVDFFAPEGGSAIGASRMSSISIQPPLNRCRVAAKNGDQALACPRGAGDDGEESRFEYEIDAIERPACAAPDRLPKAPRAIRDGG